LIEPIEKDPARGAVRWIGSLQEIDRFDCDYGLANHELDDPLGPFFNAATSVDEDATTEPP
jgi:hypothetical protein